MLSNKIIYLSFIGLLNLGLLILLIIGFTHSRSSTQNPPLENKPSSAQQQKIDNQIKFDKQIKQLQEEVSNILMKVIIIEKIITKKIPPKSGMPFKRIILPLSL
ncbi:MAG: hypothetical protein ACQBVK_05125 [Candidatus Phytoplasma sp. TWB_XP]